MFTPFLTGTDHQTQLEAVIALGETANSEAVTLLCRILDDPDHPYFLRSAAAWSLSRTRASEAMERLIAAFGDVENGIREEALEGLISLGSPAIPLLLHGLRAADADAAAGCAEALRQLQPLPQQVLKQLTEQLDSSDSSPWIVWLLGNLPRSQVASSIARLQDSAPHLQYAMSVLWAFVESWIATNWSTSTRSNWANREAQSR